MTEEYLVNKTFDEIKNSSNNIILLGSVGCGKTTLINKLSKNDGFSCTRDVQYCSTSDGSIIIDFPGLNAAEDIVKHLKIQSSTLSVIPAKMICLVTKLTTRYDDIVKDLHQMVRIFESNRDNLAIIVTFCEDLTLQQEAEIQKIIETKMKINPQNIIFSSNKMSSEMLLDKINNIKSKMTNIEKIEFKDIDLLNIVGNDGDINVIEERDKFLNEFKGSLEKFKEKFIKVEDKFIKVCFIFCIC